MAFPHIALEGLGLEGLVSSVSFISSDSYTLFALSPVMFMGLTPGSTQGVAFDVD